MQMLHRACIICNQTHLKEVDFASPPRIPFEGVGTNVGIELLDQLMIGLPDFANSLHAKLNKVKELTRDCDTLTSECQSILNHS
jgi:hypothetical protein